MSDETKHPDPLLAYREQLEGWELRKEQGLGAYADALAGIFPDLDEDKKILIRDGLGALMQGPPPFPQLDAPVAVDAEFIEDLPEPIFRRKVNEHTTEIWDWRAVAADATHLVCTDGDVTLFRYQEPLLTLTDETAAAFWKWREQTDAGFAPVRRRTRRVHSFSRKNPGRKPKVEANGS
jgi:hypothetical protein